jgi:phosphoadenosine phosphosulfate reductase
MMHLFSVAHIPAINRQLDGAVPQRILHWAVEHFHPRLTMATAFGAEGCCLIHMLAEIEPGVRVFNLETGYQFPETLELHERIRARYGIEVELVRPELSVAEYEAKHDGPLYRRRPDQCCHDRKVVPLQRALAATTPGSAPSAATRPPTGPAPRWCSGTRSLTWGRSTLC